MTKLRGKQRVFSVLVVGDEAGGPIPLLCSLLDPAFRLKWQSSAVHEGLWDWKSPTGDTRVTLKLSGITLDPNLAFDSVRSTFLAEVRKCDIVVLCFSLINPLSLQRAVRTSQMMASELAGAAKPAPLVFLVGTVRELRDALALGRQEDGLHELVRHYVNQGLLSTEDAKSFASGGMRTVGEAKIRESMLAANAAFYTEVCFLPGVGNASETFSAMAEKAAQLCHSTSAKPGSGKSAHRRTRSSASSRDLANYHSDDDNDDAELAGLAAAHLPDSFTMEAAHGKVTEWLEDELPTVVRPVTPRDGLSRSAYKQLLASAPPPPPPHSDSEESTDSRPLEGFHKVEWPTGDCYEGSWSNHLYNGQGTLKLANGSSYAGSFLQGFFHGQGTFQSLDGSSYSGSWDGGKRSGKGEQRYVDGSSFLGYWQEDMRHGEGVLSYANGTIYAGGFKLDQFHGKGRYTFNTGSTFEGVWILGKKSGSGTLHRFDGSMRKLTYQDDVLLAQETVTETKVERRASLRSQLSQSAFILMTALDITQLVVDEKEVLGEGFYGIVFRGTYKTADVAVKRLRTNIPDNVLAKFLAEVTILAGLQNEFIVRYLGAVFEENNLCIVTEYYGGGTLWEKIHDNSSQFTMAFVHKICLETASAMQYLHDECQPAVVHRDLKSPNVLLTSGTLSVRLADFGLARHLQTSADTMTKGIGTASWSAPEILRSQNYSTSADVYSFAVIVWELFARKPPFHPLERDQILLAVAVDNARPTMPPNVPVEWRSLIENCWQTEPEERPKFSEILEWFHRNPVVQ